METFPPSFLKDSRCHHWGKQFKPKKCCQAWVQVQDLSQISN